MPTDYPSVSTHLLFPSFLPTKIYSLCRLAKVVPDFPSMGEAARITKERTALKKLMTNTTWPPRTSGWPRKEGLKAGGPPKRKGFLETMDEITAEIERDTDEDEAGKRPRSSSDSSNNTLAGSPSKQPPPCKKPALETPTTREEEREPALETHTTREEEMEQALETSPEVEKEDSSNNTLAGSPSKQQPPCKKPALETPTTREEERESALKTPTSREVEMGAKGLTLKVS